MPEIPTYQAMRSRGTDEDTLYVEYVTGERELYDLGADPFQIENRAVAGADHQMAVFAARLGELRRCAAGSCRSIEEQ
jgi:hypothetical protein